MIKSLFDSQGVSRTDGEIGLVEELMTLDEILRTCVDPEKTTKDQRARFLKAVAIESDMEATYTEPGMAAHDVSEAVAWVLEGAAESAAAKKKDGGVREELEKNFAQVSNIFELFCPSVKTWKAALVPGRVSETRFFYNFFTHAVPSARDCFLSRAEKRAVLEAERRAARRAKKQQAKKAAPKKKGGGSPRAAAGNGHQQPSRAARPPPPAPPAAAAKKKQQPKPASPPPAAAAQPSKPAWSDQKAKDKKPAEHWEKVMTRQLKEFGVSREDGEVGALEELVMLDPKLEPVLDPEATTAREREVFFSHLFAESAEIETFVDPPVAPFAEHTI